MDETDSHFARCLSNGYHIDGRRHLLRDKSEPKPHLIRRLLHDGIAHWQSTGNSQFEPQLTAYPLHMREKVRKVANSQSDIGWDNALKGFLSKEWTALAACHLIEPSTLDFQTAHNRMTRVLKDLHHYTRQLWSTRNEALHSTESESMAAIRSITQAEIKHYYHHQDLLQFEDRYLFHNSLDHIFQSSQSTQSRWLQRACASAKRRKQSNNSQQLITQFFRPRTDPRSQD